jgi:hypothetical protein
MVTVKIEGNNYTLWFEHYNPNFIRPGTMSAGPDEISARYTRCVVFEGDAKEGKKLGEGYAQVHPCDNFEKSVGRVIAAERALVDAKLDTFRYEFMDAYNEVHRNPWVDVKEAKVLRDELDRYIGAIRHA